MSPHGDGGDGGDARDDDAHAYDRVSDYDYDDHVHDERDRALNYLKDDLTYFEKIVWILKI